MNAAYYVIEGFYLLASTNRSKLCTSEVWISKSSPPP